MCLKQQVDRQSPPGTSIPPYFYARIRCVGSVQATESPPRPFPVYVYSYLCSEESTLAVDLVLGIHLRSTEKQHPALQYCFILIQLVHEAVVRVCVEVSLLHKF